MLDDPEDWVGQFSEDFKRVVSNELSQIKMEAQSQDENNSKSAYNQAKAAMRKFRDSQGLDWISWRLIEKALESGAVTTGDVVVQTEQRRAVIDGEYERFSQRRMDYPEYFSKPLPLPSLEEVALPDLNNEVHPIFHFDKRSAHRDYPGLKLSLQLASLMLTAREMQPFWWSLIFGKPEPIPGRPNEILLRGPKNLNTAEKTVIDNVLVLLAGCISLRDESSKKYPCCVALPDRPAPEPLGGCQGAIRFPFYFLDHAAIRNGTSRRDPGYFALYHSFLLAKTLLHEVAHAVKIAARGTSNSVFVNDSTTSEDGFESEVQLLGGLINPGFAKASKPLSLPPHVEPLPTGSLLVVRRWPSACTVKYYRSPEMNEPIKSRKDDLDESKDRDYLVEYPRSWIYSLFTQRLWARVGKEGLVALRPRVDMFYNINSDDFGHVRSCTGLVVDRVPPEQKLPQQEGQTKSPTTPSVQTPVRKLFGEISFG